MKEKKANTKEPIDHLLASRWSPRSFTLKKKVNRNQIISICEAGRWAPSCFGDEPWRYLVFDRFDDKDSYQKAFNCLDPWNQGWVKNSQILLLSFADSKFRKNGKKNRWGQHDTGAASQNICLQATALGLMAHHMGGFDEEKVMEEFNVPKQFIPMSCIAIGYRDDEDKLSDDYYESEVGRRKRRDLGVNFFKDNWGNPIS